MDWRPVCGACKLIQLSCECEVQVAAIHLLSKDSDNRLIRICRSRELLGLISSTVRSPSFWFCCWARQPEGYSMDWLLLGLFVACLRREGPKCRTYLEDHGQDVVVARTERRNSRTLFLHI